jgi:site-specific recombinase
MIYPVLFFVALLLCAFSALFMAGSGALGIACFLLGLAVVSMIGMIYSIHAFEGGF